MSAELATACDAARGLAILVQYAPADAPLFQFAGLIQVVADNMARASGAALEAQLAN